MPHPTVSPGAAKGLPRCRAASDWSILAAGLIGLTLALAQILAQGLPAPARQAATREHSRPGTPNPAATAGWTGLQSPSPVARLTRPSVLIPGLGGLEGSLRLLGYPAGSRDDSLAISRMKILVSRLESPAGNQSEMRAPAYSSQLVMAVDKNSVHPKDHRILARIASLFQQGKDKIIFKASDPGRTLEFDSRRIKLAGLSPATGALSARFESGKANVRAIGYSVTGGTSYGTYQIASRPGTLSSFFKHLETAAPEWASRLKQAGKADTGGAWGNMPDAWRAIAEEDPGRFAAIQHEFISKTHYLPSMIQVYEQTGVNLGELSQATREVLWSAAVQHGPTGAATMFRLALDELKYRRLTPADGRDFEKALIEAIYRQRQKSFQDAPLMLRASVTMRYEREKSHALGLLMAGPKKPGKLLVIDSKASRESS
ncbi:MAG: chitosanase [Desulfovibrionaceae bacterium]|nr:chitosanase [Desulfovibrionaceae bacterium]MBF0514408.1 chitosanase [Desulfovibrionaceae bacterium]